MLIPLFKNSSDRYHFNILIIIAIIYQIYIDSELCNVAYKKIKVVSIKLNFNQTIGKWKYHDYFTRYVIFQGTGCYVKL